MFSKNRLTQKFFFILLCICSSLSIYNYEKPHKSMESLSELGLLPEIEKLLRRYGSVHTTREYIYWAIIEEIISKRLRKNLNYLTFQKLLVKRYLGNKSSMKFRTFPTFLIKPVEILLKRIKDLNGSNLETKHVLKLQRKVMYGLWPDSSDMYLSISGLLAIQRMYLLPLVEIHMDKDIGTSCQVGLTPKQILVIGMCSLFKRMYTSAVEWSEASEHFANEMLVNQITERIAIDLIIQLRYLTIQEHDKIFHELECWISYECYLFSEPIRYTSKNKGFLKRRAKRKKLVSKHVKQDTVGIIEDQLINLCSRSEYFVLPNRLQVNLKCYYEQSRHPYLYINPVKTEKLSESPLIFQYYDILGPKLIQELKAHYIENSDLLTILKQIDHYSGNIKYERLEPTPGYVPNITKIYLGHPTFTKFAEIVTGIKFIGPAEHLQYMDYTPGRGIKAHEDVDIDGNRFADLLYYLEVPIAGGYTAYCQAGVKAHPVKGSLVIWINKFRNGTNRKDMFHGACPVIRGSKMILAQGIKYIGQENHFKCTLNQFE